MQILNSPVEHANTVGSPPLFKGGDPIFEFFKKGGEPKKKFWGGGKKKGGERFSKIKGGNPTL